MITLHINGCGMADLDIGRGPPLVCVHGCLCDFRIWSPVLGPLTRKHRVIAVSLRHFFPEHWDGHNGSYSIAQHTADMIDFIEKLDAGPVDLMGHSRGGHVSFRVAQRRPDLLRKLILAEPGGELDPTLDSRATRRPPGSWPAFHSSRLRRSRLACRRRLSFSWRHFEGPAPGPAAGDAEAIAARQRLHPDHQVRDNWPPFSRADAEAIENPTLFIGGASTRACCRRYCTRWPSM
jgi:pimeloyl-ACP methyl ester carboxylesterase